MELKLENGRPADTTGRLEKEIRTYDFLDALQVPYQRIDHETLMTIEACKDVDKVCSNLQKPVSLQPPGNELLSATPARRQEV